jgi:ribosomal protein L10
LTIEWKKRIASLKIKGAFLEGSALGAEEAAALAKMPTRAQMLSQFVAMTLSAASKLSGAITAPASVVCACIKAAAEKQQKQAA